VTEKTTVPPIRTWWPYLTAGARHEVLRDPHAPLGERVRAEIRTITEQTVEDGARLDDRDVQFAHEQMETVD
jgi:hypothetical protein